MAVSYTHLDVYKRQDVLIVKQGYIFPELKAKAAVSVMSLTEGATLRCV